MVLKVGLGILFLPLVFLQMTFHALVEFGLVRVETIDKVTHPKILETGIANGFQELWIMLSLSLEPTLSNLFLTSANMNLAQDVTS